ncbi:hypothetical protein DASC09_001110 [Saccharomycopsis crataegensis]|uniref:Uncharacterized protein n=1 Tax=Saccharomycopsis crataegensis TaxID=43959 RepID=A0AAV5QDQ9_9ASCO|nr:hypothetical protein DASC09_001110 [Saccharomycopsis crataegensis]
MFSRFANFEWFQLEYLRSREKWLRHTSIIFLVLYIIFGCIVVSGCTSSSVSELNIAKLTYTATEAAMKESPSGVTKLEVNMGYFASCIVIHTNDSVSSTSCSTNETTILLANSNQFDQTQVTNADLFNFMVGTAKRFRVRCMDPYSLIVAVILSFICVVSFAFTSPVTANHMYKYAAGLSYISFTLSLVSAIWLQTNITTATGIMNRMADQYFTLSATRGSVDNGLLWAGVAMQLSASIVTGLLGVLGQQIEEVEEDLGLDEKI